MSRTHGLSRTPTYRSWQAAKERCTNPNHTKYPGYGALGIKMCGEWEQSFEQFLLDMGIRPAGMTLDRIDPFGNYEKSNCRWATYKTQGSNKRSNKLWNGEWLTLAEIAKEVGVARTSLTKYFNEGRTIEDAVEQAISRRRWEMGSHR